MAENITSVMKRPIDVREPTDEQRAQIDSLHGEPDTDDIPEAPEENWATAVRGKFYRRRMKAEQPKT
jgi:hypothetical protein